MDSIIFTTEDNEQVEMYVLEQTMLGGHNYLLVVDTMDEEEEAECLILKENQSESHEDLVTYDIVEDDRELQNISKIFEELLEDVNIEV